MQCLTPERETQSWSRGQLPRWPAGMRGVVSASRQVGVAPVLSCRCPGSVTLGLGAGGRPSATLGPGSPPSCSRLLQNEMEVGRLFGSQLTPLPSPHGYSGSCLGSQREVCLGELRFSWNLGSYRGLLARSTWRWPQAPPLLRTLPLLLTPHNSQLRWSRFRHLSPPPQQISQVR